VHDSIDIGGDRPICYTVRTAQIIILHAWLWRMPKMISVALLLQPGFGLAPYCLLMVECMKSMQWRFQQFIEIFGIDWRRLE